MDSPLLETLSLVIPPIDGVVLAPDTIRILLSDAPNPQVEPRLALVIDWRWDETAAVVAELEGAQAFVFPAGEGPYDLRPTVSVVTPGGTVTRIDSAGRRWQTEIATDERNGPMFLGQLTCKLITSEELYVAGMSRQLYRGTPDAAAWTRADDGLVDTSFENDWTALYGLCLGRDRSLIAVGGGGEIWRGVNAGWRQLDSGTNVMLNDVTPLPDRDYVVCGAGGVLLRLHEDGQVTFIDHDLGQGFLSQVEVYGTSLFVMAPNGLHRFELGGQLRYLEKVAESTASHQLVKDPDSLWLVGRTTIGRSLDGVSWEWASTATISVTAPAR